MSESQSDIIGTREQTMHLSETQRHELLSSERRRATLDALRERHRATTLEDLATAVANNEHGTVDEDRIAISLHHNHLPKMDSFGILEYEPESRLVRL